MILLRVESLARRKVGVRLPVIHAVDLVERDDEGGLSHAKHVEGLEGLRFETVHDVDDEDGEIAERRTARSEVGE